MFTSASFNLHREGNRISFSFLFMMLIPAIAAGLLAYSPSPLSRVSASGVEAAVKARAISPNRGALAAEFTDAIFQARGLAGKCVAFGKLRTIPGVPHFENNDPVFLYDCNGTPNQQVRVVELRPGTYRSGNIRPREVQLRAADKCIGAGGNFIVPNVPLQLQDCNGSRGQIFALDGDSIIFANERRFVVEVRNARSQNSTPLVVGERDLDDSEFWSFIATDGTGARPTSGFVRVSNAFELFWALQEAQWGSVIEVESVTPINMQLTFNIPAGVTIRGSRRGLAEGAELYWPDLWEGPMLSIEGDHVRITGLRLRGPSSSKDSGLPWIKGVRAREKFFSIIDHNELSNWPGEAVGVIGDLWFDRCEEPEKAKCLPLREDLTINRVRVARNFIHHNQRQGSGYGVVTGEGAFPLIEGNTFVSNRHAIAGDGRPGTGYRAWHNLVQADAPLQDGFLIHNYYTQDFDMHGTDCGDGLGGLESDWVGGLAGEYIRIYGNTFLGTNRNNFNLRGVPCYLAEFHGNVSLRSRGGAIDYFRPLTLPIGVHPTWLSVESNQFESPNPTDRLGVGDFDGDGREDTFLATGAAWYYSPGGQAEWRYLNDYGDELDELLLGDFDGDGRTDILTQSGRDLKVSWGGISRKEKINAQDGQISDYHVGNFDGDRRDDVFYANGGEWFLSLDGVAPFTHFAYAVHRARDLRFGDFNGDGRTDVFGVVDGDWKVVYGGTQFWSRLRAKLTNNVNDLVVADFNGDGRADVATSSNDGFYFDWRISLGGLNDWAPLRNNATVALDAVPAIGQFNTSGGEDVLFWPGQYSFQMGRPVLMEENYFNIASSGTGSARHSLHDMR